jgi:23S rRNA (uridine2552-2'-O)-methyltransferase
VVAEKTMTTSSGDGGRSALKVKVKKSRKRTVSSKRWLERQLNDPYVTRAKKDGYRSRAAYKFIEIDDRFHLLKPGARVLDLGAAPGGWTQISVQRVGVRGRVVGLDLLPIDAIPGAALVEMDFMDETAPAVLMELLGGPADVVLSDMAANTTGHKKTDHLKIIGLVETAVAFARDVLAPGGSFVAKVFQGGADGTLLAELKRDFATVRHVKPAASRAESSELYVVATGFRRAPVQQD